MNTHPLTRQLDDFLSTYSRCLEAFSPEGLAISYELPTLFLEDDSSRAVISETDLEEHLHQRMARFQEVGACFFQHRLLKVHVMTSQLLTIDVEWQQLSADHSMLFESEFTYIVRLSNDQPIKICVSASLNEKERIIAYSVNQEAPTVHVTGFLNHRQTNPKIQI